MKEQHQSATEKLIALYEEGRNCLFSLSILESEQEDYHRLFEILMEMRDLKVNNNEP